MIAFINLFCMPCLTLCIYYNRKKENPKFSAKLLLQYGVATVIINVISRIIYLVYCKLFSDTFSFDRIEYAVISLIIAVILPIVYEFLKKYISVHVEVLENKPQLENEIKDKSLRKDEKDE